MPVKLLSSFFGWGVLGNCTALDVAFLETASCLGIPFPEREKKSERDTVCTFWFTLITVARKTLSFSRSLRTAGLALAHGRGRRLSFSTHPARSGCTNPFLGAGWKFPLLGAVGLARSVRALRGFLVPQSQGCPPPPPPAAFPGPDPGRRKFFPSSLGLASRDQPPPLPLPEGESLKVTEEISTDTATGPQEGSARFPAA